MQLVSDEIKEKFSRFEALKKELSVLEPELIEIAHAQFLKKSGRSLQKKRIKNVSVEHDKIVFVYYDMLYVVELD